MLALRMRTALRPTTARGISTKFEAAPRELSASGQASRVVFGAKAAAERLGALSREAGVRKMLVVRDRDAGAAARTQYAEFLLMQAGVPCFQYTLERDCATTQSVDHALATAERVGADGVLAFGGGNTMDMARAVAVLLAQGGSAADWMAGEDATGEPAHKAPLLLVPTIAGSGVEAATRALVLDEDAEAKLPFASGRPIVADAVVIDPLLAVTVPLRPTVQGALAALGQCLESYLLGCADDKDEQLALQGVEAVAGALATPLKDGRMDLKAAAMREQLALASLLAGVAANSSGCGATQAVTVGMGGISDLPHSHVAASFLPFVFDRYAALAAENAGDPFFDALGAKLESAADRLTAASGFQGASVAAWLRYVATRFDLPLEAELELDQSLLEGVVDRAAMHQDAVLAAVRTDGEGAILEKEDLRAIVDSAVQLAEAPAEKPADK